MGLLFLIQIMKITVDDSLSLNTLKPNVCPLIERYSLETLPVVFICERKCTRLLEGS